MLTPRIGLPSRSATTKRIGRAFALGEPVHGEFAGDRDLIVAGAELLFERLQSVQRHVQPARLRRRCRGGARR